jgi:transposase
MENPTTIAVDLSKNVFEIAVERQGRVCQRKRLNRRQTIAFLSGCAKATVLLETCGSAHYFGRVAEGFGHTVKLLPAQRVAKNRIGNKTDRRDTGAILRSGTDERIIAVPVKSIEQQTICALHRVRAALMKTRTARLNTARGLLREFGVTIAEGAERVLAGVREALAESPSPVPEPLHAVVLSIMAEAGELQQRSFGVEKQLKALSTTVLLVERLEQIPGIGLLNATALSGMVGNFTRFESGRKFASSLGLTPKESSSGQSRWLGPISKAGDTYLRTLLIAGGRSMLLAAHRTKSPHRLQAWALEVEKRRGRNRAAVAVANKLARIVWAVSTRGLPFKPTFDIQSAPKTDLPETKD